MASRKHTAARYYRKSSGVLLRCRAEGCTFEVGEGTTREKEDAFRAHRVEMGETVAPRKLSGLERMEAKIDDLEAEKYFLVRQLNDLRKSVGVSHHYCDRCAHALDDCVCRKEES